MQNLWRRIRGTKSVAQNLRREICEVKHVVLPGLQHEMYLVQCWFCGAVSGATHGGKHASIGGTRYSIGDLRIQIEGCAVYDTDLNK
jgi:hypothetical protein